MVDVHVTITGPVTVNQVDLTPLLDRLTTMGDSMTAAFGSVGEALDALQAKAEELANNEAADRAAFDALATVVREFLANMPAPGEVLTEENAAQAQAILDTLTVANVSEQQGAADETALAGEIPA